MKSYALGDVKYSWLEHNDLYDCIVGISVDGIPISSGFLGTSKFVITSANPIERVNDVEKVKIHVINGDPNQQQLYDISHITRDQFHRFSQNWISFGFDDRHSPIYDILIISSVKDIPIEDKPKPRHPFATPMYTAGEHIVFQSGGKFAYAGFGFIDKLHVKQNFELELVEYTYDEVWEDCWEWIPAVWGIFICLSNVENFVGISSGAVLFYNGRVVGLGSFSIKRGSEGVLVFTNFHKYRGRLNAYYIY